MLRAETDLNLEIIFLVSLISHWLLGNSIIG